MKTIHVVGLVLAVALLTSLAVYAVLELQPAKNTQETSYVFSVNQSIGFDGATDVMRLGSVIPGASARRDITITDEGSSVTTTFSGLGSEWLYAQPSKAQLVDGQATITILLATPENATVGRYEGAITFETR